MILEETDYKQVEPNTITDELRASLRFELLKKEIERCEKIIARKREEMKSLTVDKGIITESDMMPGKKVYDMTAIWLDKAVFLGNSTHTRRLELGEQFKLHARRIYGTASSSELYIETEIGTIKVK